MLADVSRLGIVAGNGSLPEYLIFQCKQKKVAYYTIGIKGFFVPSSDSYKPNMFLKLSNIGNMFSIFHTERVTHVVFIGGVKKPLLISLLPNLVTLKYIFKLLYYYRKGDNEFLSKIIKITEKQGFKVIGSDKILDSYIAKKGLLNNFKNFKLNKKLISKSYLLAKDYGLSDKGQALVLKNNKVISLESSRGTDAMLNYLYKKNTTGDLLVKVMKPMQDIRIDLPTIGPKTVMLAGRIGIRGIIIDSNSTYIVDLKETIQIADKLNIFIYGV